MPTMLQGLGPDHVAPLVNRDLDPARAGLRAEEYFVLTRVDGRTSFRELVLISGFPEGQTLTILRHLRQLGAIYLPGEDPARPPAPEPEDGPDPDAPQPIDDAALDPRILAEDVELTDPQRKLILRKHASLAGATYFSVLGVPRTADKKAVKAAYRRISKDFHPDRYYGKRLGSYAALLAQIFELANDALEVLSDDGKRDEYVARLAGARSGATPPLGSPTGGSGPHAAAPHTDKQRAAELFEEACHHQVIGELRRSLPEFAAAIALDPVPRYLRRAAEAFLKAQELRDAEEYAKKAAELNPLDAAAHRVHGKVLLARGRRKEARRALETAARLDPGNPHIAAELRGLGPSPSEPDGEG